MKIHRDPSRRQAPADAPPLSRAGTEPEAIAHRLHSAAIHLLRRLRAEDEASGLTAPRLSALSVIVFAGPIRVGDLARAEQVSAPTISRLVAALEADGLVERSADPADGRVQRMSATERGRALLEAGRARRVERLAAELGGLPPADRATLARAAELLEHISRPAEHPGQLPSRYSP